MVCRRSGGSSAGSSRSGSVVRVAIDLEVVAAVVGPPGHAVSLLHLEEAREDRGNEDQVYDEDQEARAIELRRAQQS